MRVPVLRWMMADGRGKMRLGKKETSFLCYALDFSYLCKHKIWIQIKDKYYYIRLKTIIR